MKYTQTTDSQTTQMLDAIGVKSIDELFAPIPPKFRLRGDLNIPRGLSELEMLRDAESLATRNKHAGELVCFLGGGAYDHFIPTVVDALSTGQSEFLTAYTPYQAEASQGILQLFYEFQTMVCMLTGMEVANASMYEFTTAAAEAVLMAHSITDRSLVLIADTVHPDTRRVVETYLAQLNVELVAIPSKSGLIDEAALADLVTDSTAAIVVQSPNFYGCVERLDRVISQIRDKGALAIVCTDPISGGVLKTPGELGADIVVGEGQCLGVPLQYGGPYLGLLATREKYLRKMPGRVVGMTTDKDGKRGFCLALQTREQHIKRERATSNICTNQGLLAIRAAVYMAVMGKNGIAEVASQCFDKAHYAADRIGKIKGFELAFPNAPFFKEFTVRTSRDVTRVMEACRQCGILGGVPLSRFDAENTAQSAINLSDCFLVAVTENRTKDEIDRLVGALEAA